jgi:hypothetical protein
MEEKIFLIAKEYLKISNQSLFDLPISKDIIR